MIQRRQTKQIFIGQTAIGGGAQALNFNHLRDQYL
jgi:hypothetical protein